MAFEQLERAQYRRAQVGHMTCGQQVIDEDQEALVDDVGVGQQEGDFSTLAADLGVQAQQVCLEFRHAIGGIGTDLEDLMATQKAGHPAGQRHQDVH